MIKLYILSLLLLSCAVTYKDDRPENIAAKEKTQAEIAEQERLKALEDETKWQHQFYEHVEFRVKNPLIVDNNTKLDGICNGDDFEFKESYQFKPLSYIKFKKTPISLKTESGFTKKVFVTKGACRELLLFKKRKGDSDQLRKSIKEMRLLYVYNVGTYLMDTTFNTKFDDVDFYVK